MKQKKYQVLKPQNGEYIVSNNFDNNVIFSLVIPTLEESENIAILLERIIILLDKKILDQYEIIVVDDNSKDKTWKLVAEMTQKHPQLKIIRRLGTKGLATAVIRGWQEAKGKYLGVMDGDLQHPIEPMLKALSEIKNYDIIVASRYVENGINNSQIKRKFLSKSARLLGKLLLPKVIKKVSDPLSGYFIIKRETIAEIEMHPIGYKILLEVLARGRIESIKEIGYIFGKREKGVSKAKSKAYIDYILHLLKLQVTSWPLFRLRKWVTVGVSGFAVDMLMFFILLNFLNIPLTISAFLSAEIAIINNFFWNDRWTFGDLAKKTPGLYKKGMRFWKFNLICLSGLVLHTIIIRWFVFGFEINPYIAKVLTIIIVSIWNLLLNFRFSWDVPSKHEEISRRD